MNSINSQCLNNGTLIIDLKSNSTKCMCPLGFTGDQCEIGYNLIFQRKKINLKSIHLIRSDIHPCKINICQNGGDCYIDSNSLVTCVCSNEFTGTFCELKSDICLGKPCAENSTCATRPNGEYMCLCQRIYILKYFFYLSFK